MKSLVAKTIVLSTLGPCSHVLMAESNPTAEVVSLYVDTYYSYNFNKPSPTSSPKSDPDADASHIPYRGAPIGGTRYRNFDVYHNQFSLALAELSYKRTMGETSLKVDFDFGDITEMTHNTGHGTDEVSKNIGQAVISYSPKSINFLTLNLGKMPTHLGYEVTKAKDNWQYSRSFLFAYAIPYWHQGINATFTIVPDLLTAGFYVYNGWNSMYDNNRGKTIGAQVVLTPSQYVSFIYNGIGGPEQEGKEKPIKQVHEIIVTLSLSDSMSLAADFVVGSEQQAIDTNGDGTNDTEKWSAFQWGLKYSPTPEFYLSPRLESYWDPQGYTTGTSQTLSEATLTGGWKLNPQLETRLEMRQDHSTSAVFTKNHATVKNQPTITASSLVTF